MKERHRKGKKQDLPAAESPPKSSPLDRFCTYADGPQGQWTVPAAVSLLTLCLGVWTFDAKLSLSGDNTEFITLARSVAQGDGLSYINQPAPRPATAIAATAASVMSASDMSSDRSNVGLCRRLGGVQTAS